MEVKTWWSNLHDCHMVSVQTEAGITLRAEVPAVACLSGGGRPEVLQAVAVAALELAAGRIDGRNGKNPVGPKPRKGRRPAYAGPQP